MTYKDLRLFLFFNLLFFVTNLHAEETLKSAIDLRLQGQQETIDAQTTIDQLANQKRDMVQEFQLSTIQIGDLRVYNDQLEKLVEKQRQELASFDHQLESGKEAQRTIVPMMLKMVKVLKKFIALDSPFLKKERHMRVEALQEMLDQPSVSIAEKYRRILEAYQIEADYGRTIEAYNGDIELNGKTRSVEFLRIGRVALLYSNPDGSETGIWDKPSKQWQALSGEYRESIKQGLRIARKEAPPELIKIPLSLTPVRNISVENKGEQK